MEKLTLQLGNTAPHCALFYPALCEDMQSWEGKNKTKTLHTTHQRGGYAAPLPVPPDKGSPDSTELRDVTDLGSTSAQHRRFPSLPLIELMGFGSQNLEQRIWKVQMPEVMKDTRQS